MNILLGIIRFVILVIVSFYMCQIVTNKNKRISTIGTFLISVSTAVVTYINSGLAEALIFGQLFLICLNYFLIKETNKYIYALGMGLSEVGFLLLSNISFQISIGLTLIAIIIWNIIKNKSDIKVNKKQWGILVAILLLVTVISVVFYKPNEMKLLENENGLSYVMSYTYSVMIPFNSNIKYEDSTCLSTMISVFPMVLILAVYYVFKYEKHYEFFMPAIIMTILEIISISLNKPLFYGIVPNYIMVIAIALLQIYMMIYIFSNVTERMFKLTPSAYIALGGILFVFLFKFPQEISSVLSREVAVIMFVLESFIVLNYSDRRFWRLASVVFPIITMIESIGLLIVNFV